MMYKARHGVSKQVVCSHNGSNLAVSIESLGQSLCWEGLELKQQAANINVPAIEGAFWIGGFHSSGITTTGGDQTQDYAVGMLGFNTTTQVATQLDAPFAPVQEGALQYLPYGDQGLLVYLGGETPSGLSGPDLYDYASPVGFCSVFLLAT